MSKSIVIATGVTASGDREVLGLAVGDSEDGAFWTAFLRSLRARGLSGVRLVVSDAHEGLKRAIGAVLLGSAWQRCRVHFLRNVLARIPKGSAEMVLAARRRHHPCGWTEDLIRREETLGTIEIVDGQAHRQTHGRTDYTSHQRADGVDRVEGVGKVAWIAHI